jgi:uncharacterized protein
LPPDFQNAVAMNPFAMYSIPIQGLKIGIHRFSYDLDRDFFRHFEESPVAEASMHIDLQFDKRSDMLVLDFTLRGHVRTECDRCTAPINLPLEDERQLVVKYGEPDEADDADDEVVFISREASEFNVAQYLYEFTVLALPITNTYDCQDDPVPPCNFEILNFLKAESEANQSNPAWDALKGFEKDN